MAGDIESRMEFIIQQQAEFTADIQELKERQAETGRHIEANARLIEANTVSIRQLVDVTMSLARPTESLTEHAGDTGKKLNALIDTVDKVVRRNGGTS